MFVLQTGGPEFGSPVPTWKAMDGHTRAGSPSAGKVTQQQEAHWDFRTRRKMIKSRFSQSPCLKGKGQQSPEEFTQHSPQISIMPLGSDNCTQDVHTSTHYSHTHKECIWLFLYNGNTGIQNPFLWAPRCSAFTLWQCHACWHSLAFPCTSTAHQFLAHPRINRFLDFPFCSIDLVV